MLKNRDYLKSEFEVPTVGVPIFGRRSYRLGITNTKPPLTAQFSKTSTLIITAGPQ